MDTMTKAAMEFERLMAFAKDYGIRAVGPLAAEYEDAEGSTVRVSASETDGYLYVEGDVRGAFNVPGLFALHRPALLAAELADAGPEFWDDDED